MEDAPTHFDFPEPARIAPPILALDRVAVGYDGKPVLRGLSLRIDMDDRIALLGANGNGKSTLAKLLAGRLAPLAGEVRRGSEAAGRLFRPAPDRRAGPRRNAGRPHGARPAACAAAGRCAPSSPASGWTPTAPTRRSRNLSGGEKARLLLALATRDAPQLLILDEPTNHLDIDAREALVRALADFEGAVLLITHDPHLVELVADRLWLVADGTVRPFDGDLDDYRALLAERARPARAPTPRRAGATTAANVPRPAPPLAPLRRRAREAEARIADLAAERARDRGEARRSCALCVGPRRRGHRGANPAGGHRPRNRGGRSRMAGRGRGA